MRTIVIGEDYINEDGLIVIDRLGSYGNRGFDGNNFEHDLFCSSPNVWREASGQEVVKAFENHLVHRYGEDWKTMKIKESHPDSGPTINHGGWDVEFSKLLNGWNVWNKNGLLYCGGIWVERLEEKELEKIHIKDAIKEKTVVYCGTEEEANRVLGMAHTLGYKWWTGRNYENNTEWGIYKSKICYDLFEGSYSHYDYFNSKNYTIIHSTQIADLKPEELAGWSLAPEEIEEKSDKKRYEVIKTTFSDFKQISLGDNKINKIVAHFVEHDEDTLLLAEKIAYILNLMEK